MNLESGQVLAEQVFIAERFFSRLRGLMFRPTLSSEQCLHILPCRSVHTFWMRFPIDIIYLNQEQYVVGWETGLMPGRFGKRVNKARSVVEFHAGKLKDAHIQEGNKLWFTH